MQPFIKTGNLVIPETHQTAAQGGKTTNTTFDMNLARTKKLEEIVSL